MHYTVRHNQIPLSDEAGIRYFLDVERDEALPAWLARHLGTDATLYLEWTVWDYPEREDREEVLDVAHVSGERLNERDRWQAFGWFRNWSAREWEYHKATERENTHV